MITGKESERVAALKSRLLHPLKRMKLIPKLSISYILIILLCIAIIGGFYYIRLYQSITQSTEELLGNNISQAEESLEYKIELYNTLADILYLNSNMQELLFKEYFEPISRYIALDEIQKHLLPLMDGYKDVASLRLYVTNETIVPFEDYVMSIKNVEKDAFYSSLSIHDDNVKWLIMENMPVPGNGSGGYTPSPGAEAPMLTNQIAVIKNMRHLPTGTYLGFLMVRINMESLFRGISYMEDASEGWFDVTDKNGKLIYSAADKNANNGEESYVDRVQALYGEILTETESSVTLPVDGKDYLLLSRTIEPTGWKIFYVNPLSRYQSDMESLRTATIILVGISLTLFALLSYFMAMGFSKKILLLSQSMKHLEDGNFNIRIPVSGSDEIDKLGEGFNVMTHELKKLMDEVVVVKEREKEAELKALQAQINPHFLYNTLASISYLSAEYGAEDIMKISNALAKFYRISLSKGRNIIRIRDELEHIRAYMDIQDIRFKKRIRMIYEVDPAVLNGSSPKLLLQPFVENAVLHGMWVNKKSIIIRIVVKREADLVLWQVIDDGVGMDRETLDVISGDVDKPERGYGAVNVDRRIKVSFGEEYGVKVFSLLGAGTSVTLSIPYIPYDEIADK